MALRGTHLLAAACLVACNAIIGNDDRRLVAVDAGLRSCLLPSDCAAGDVCLFQICSEPCREDVDCGTGYRCLKTEAGTACVSAEQAQCSQGPCPEGTTCSGGSCRTMCGEGAAACRSDQTCSTDGTCFGRDRTHDPGAESQIPSGRGGGAGVGGTSGLGGAGGAATGGFDTSGGDTGAGGDIAGAGGDGAGGRLTETGGAPPLGGTPGSGGLPESGGFPNAGGAGTGGVPGPGGTPGTGGVQGPGGTPGSGGQGTGGQPVVTIAPVIPAITGACPTFTEGTTTSNSIGGLSGITLAVGPRRSGTGPLLFYWHGTGSQASEYVSVLPAAVRQEILNAGGIIVSPQSSLGTGTNCSGTAVFWSDDFNVSDLIAACAVRDYGIDPRRIYTTGCSGGGLMAGCMAARRSSYIAAVVTNSGGTASPQPIQDPTRIPAVMTMHGGPSDVVVVSFATTSRNLDQQFKTAGGFVVNCDHGGGHCASPAALQSAGWQFMKDHPFGVDPEPYTSGVPGTFPAYCTPF